VSATTVSRTTGYLDEELKKYRTKPLTDDFDFLFLDGITQKVREIGVRKKMMLCALGMNEDGRRESLSFQMVDREDVESWRAFLVDLKSRGLQGKNLKLITTDGNPALLKAIKEIYPFLKVQRCIVHKLRNVAIKLKRVHLKPCMAGAKDIFNAPSRREAIRRFKTWQEVWQVEEERAVRCMEKTFTIASTTILSPKSSGKRSAPPTFWSGTSARSGGGPGRWASSPTKIAPRGSPMELQTAFMITGSIPYL
jgi:putative transposase